MKRNDFKVDKVFYYILKRSKGDSNDGVLVKKLMKVFNLKKGAMSQIMQKLYKFRAVKRYKEGKMTRYYSTMQKSEYDLRSDLLRRHVTTKEQEVSDVNLTKFIFSGSKERIVENLYL